MRPIRNHTIADLCWSHHQSHHFFQFLIVLCFYVILFFVFQETSFVSEAKTNVLTFLMSCIECKVSEAQDSQVRNLDKGEEQQGDGQHICGKWG